MLVRKDMNMRDYSTLYLSVKEQRFYWCSAFHSLYIKTNNDTKRHVHRKHWEIWTLL